jgi:hypothetical protein
MGNNAFLFRRNGEQSRCDVVVTVFAYLKSFYLPLLSQTVEQRSLQHLHLSVDLPQLVLVISQRVLLQGISTVEVCPLQPLLQVVRKSAQHLALALRFEVNLLHHFDMPSVQTARVGLLDQHFPPLEGSEVEVVLLGEEPLDESSQFF